MVTVLKTGMKLNRDALQAIEDASHKTSKKPTNPKSNGEVSKKAKKLDGVSQKPESNGGVNHCLCGCKGSTGSKFMPGHDARLKGILQRAWRDGSINATQKAQVRDLGWERFMEKTESSVNGTKASANGAKTGANSMSVAQLNILKALQKAPNGLTRSQIQAKVGVSIPMAKELGPVFKEDNEAMEAKTGRKTLIGLKYVNASPGDKDTIVYKLSHLGGINLKKFSVK